jgi:protein-S-isoprenylcysteine O-methyltransferase Ste14
VRTAWALVALQFVLLGLLVLLPFRSDWPVPGWLVAVAVAAGAVGLVVMLVGANALGRGLTAAPLPNVHARLRTDGLYGHVRHPIYSGLLLVGAAIAAVSGSGLRLAVYVLLVGLLTVKARWEEERLRRRFPDYAAYAARTPRFVPRLGRPR